MKEQAFAWMKECNGNLPTVELLTKCARRDIKLDVQEEVECMEWYWKDVLDVAHPTNEWKNVMMVSVPSQAKNDQDNIIITSASEALAVVMFDNNREKWMAQYKYLHIDKLGKSIPTRSTENLKNPALKNLFKAKYTIQDGGQKPCGGWTKEGKKEFVKLKGEIKKARNDKDSRKLEKDFLECLKKNSPQAKEPAKKKRKKSEVEIVDTLDDDFE